MNAKKEGRWDKSVGLAIGIGCALAIAVGIHVLWKGSIMIWPGFPHPPWP